MKAGELLQLLKKVNPEAEVILQKDAEGNGYSPLSGIDAESVYVPDSSYSGGVYSLAWSAYEADKTEDEWNALQRQPCCVVLFPVN